MNYYRNNNWKSDGEASYRQYSPDSVGNDNYCNYTESDPQDNETTKLFQEVVKAWNEIFTSKHSRYTDMYPSSVLWNNFTASSKIYTLDEFIEAFQQARRGGFGWLLDNILKPSNIKMLLVQKEAAERYLKEQEEEKFAKQKQSEEDDPDARDKAELLNILRKKGVIK